MKGNKVVFPNWYEVRLYPLKQHRPKSKKARLWKVTTQKLSLEDIPVMFIQTPETVMVAHIASTWHERCASYTILACYLDV